MMGKNDKLSSLALALTVGASSLVYTGCETGPMEVGRQTIVLGSTPVLYTLNCYRCNSALVSAKYMDTRDGSIGKVIGREFGGGIYMEVVGNLNNEPVDKIVERDLLSAWNIKDSSNRAYCSRCINDVR